MTENVKESPSLAKRLGRYLPRPPMADVDEWYSGYAATIPGIAGSWLSFLYFAAGIWAVISIALGRYPLSVPARARPFVWACLIYSASMLFSSALNDGLDGFQNAFTKVAAFLLVPLFIARYSFSDPTRSLRAMISFAPLGAILGVAAGLYQSGFGAAAVEAAAGNANVYGLVMAWLGYLSLAGMLDSGRKKPLLALAGFVCGVVGIVLSEARSLYPAIVLAPMALLLTSHRMEIRKTVIAAMSIVVALTISGFLLKERIGAAISSFESDISMIEVGRLNSSVGQRIALWRASVEAIAEKPILGHGISSKMEAVRRHLEDQVSFIEYTHVHNALLDGWIAGGVLGALAVVAIFLTPFFHLRKRVADSGVRLDRYILFSHAGIFALSGAVGALFLHDLIATLFLMPLIIVLSQE